jgi:hypothetical protein
MGYDANDVEPLWYNFGAYGDGERHDIKEPSDKQVRKFFKAIAKEDRISREQLLATIGNRDGETDDERNARLTEHAEEYEDLQTEIAEQSRHHVLEYLSAVCSGDPSVEQLEKLPERMQIGFFRDIRTELVPKD